MYMHMQCGITEFASMIISKPPPRSATPTSASRAHWTPSCEWRRRLCPPLRVAPSISRRSMSNRRKETVKSASSFATALAWWCLPSLFPNHISLCPAFSRWTTWGITFRPSTWWVLKREGKWNSQLFGIPFLSIRSAAKSLATCWSAFMAFICQSRKKEKIPTEIPRPGSCWKRTPVSWLCVQFVVLVLPAFLTIELPSQKCTVIWEAKAIRTVTELLGSCSKITSMWVFRERAVLNLLCGMWKGCPTHSFTQFFVLFFLVFFVSIWRFVQREDRWAVEKYFREFHDYQPMVLESLLAKHPLRNLLKYCT